MLIGELSARSGFSRDTIRFYEKQGLVHINRKHRRLNNYKEYDQKTLEDLLTIKKLKGFGFTLNETSGYLELIANNTASCTNVAEKVAEKLLIINAKITELEELKKTMITLVDKCVSCCKPAVSNENCRILISKD